MSIFIGNLLVAYYSWSNGNTKKIAEKLADALNADKIVRIETVTPYSGSYDDVVKQGKSEVENGFIPEIKLLDTDNSETELDLA